MAQYDLSLQQDFFQPVTPPDFWEGLEVGNSQSSENPIPKLWNTSNSEQSLADFESDISPTQCDSTVSTEFCNGDYNPNENTSSNSSNNEPSYECSPVDQRNLPSPLNLLPAELLCNGESPDSSTSPNGLNKDKSGNNGLSKDWKANALKYPPCVVCSGKSSGLHYGCYTCEACKNFFRRYLLRSGGFNCKKNNNCVISNRSRGNCSGCRLKKCLEVGMSKEKSKIGRYTHAQRTETIREVNKLEGKEEDDLFLDTGETALPVNLEEKPVKTEEVEQYEDLTDDEKELINILVEAMDNVKHFGEKGATAEGREEIIQEHYEKYLDKVKLFGPLKAIPKEEYFTLLKMYNIDLDGRWNRFKQEANNCAHIVTRYCEFAYKIPGFQLLHLKDQEALLKLGHCDFFLVLMHEGYDSERQIFLEMNGVPSHIEEAADKIFSREMVETQAEIFSRWQAAKLTKEEKALLMAMSLVCSDRIDLESPESVSDLHMKITDILLKFMHSVYGKEARKRFAKFIDILTFSRQGSYLYFKEYNEMSQNEMVANAAPAFSTLCPEKY